MNIMKGVTEFIMRSSGTQTGEPDLTSELKIYASSLKICFSKDGNEALLYMLWKRCDEAVHKEEKRRNFYVFLKEFICAFKNWDPGCSSLSGKGAQSTSGTVEVLSHFNELGCTYGHPSEVIMALTEEIEHVIASVANIGNSSMLLTVDMLGISTSLSIISEAFPVLEALTIVTRSIHNCRIFCYYGGVKKLTALMKELLRIQRRLSMKELWTNFQLQHLLLKALLLVLSDNPRAQHQFKSIGGLEVLLDGLGAAASYILSLTKSTPSSKERKLKPIVVILGLHILSLQVLREAVFGNLSNLQFICENGRVHKLASSFSLPALMLHDYTDGGTDIHFIEDSQILQDEKYPDAQSPSVQFITNGNWNDYVTKVCHAFCSFVLFPEEAASLDMTVPTARTVTVSPVYQEFSIRWSIRTLVIAFTCINACTSRNEYTSRSRSFIRNFQSSIICMFRKVVMSRPSLIEVIHEEGLWDFLFSEKFFYSGPVFEEFSEEFLINDQLPFGEVELTPRFINVDDEIASVMGSIQQQVISFAAFTGTYNGSSKNLPECSVLLDALEQLACNPVLATTLARSLLCILQQRSEKTVASFNALDAFPRFLTVTCIQTRECRRLHPLENNSKLDFVYSQKFHESALAKSSENWLRGMQTSFDLFKEYFSMADGAKRHVLNNSLCIECLFDLFWEETLRDSVLEHIIGLMKFIPLSEDGKRAKIYLCSKYLETFTLVKEREKRYVELSINLLVGMRDLILSEPLYYQELFRDAQCFLHIVSLLNGNLDDGSGGMLIINVLQTLTYLLAGNDASKDAFRSLVGDGYRTLQKLLLNFRDGSTNELLLSNLLDMLVDGKFNIKLNPLIKNEDVVILYLSLLQKSDESLQHFGLNVFNQLLSDCVSNRPSCVRAGMLNFLLDWFSNEPNENVILKITHLIQIIGGHSISGSDIRKIFSLLWGGKAGKRQKYCLLLLRSVSFMLNERGPTVFFDFNGTDSGISIKTPVQWPLNRGFSFSCWIRAESFPDSGGMGFFTLLSESGRGFYAVLGEGKLIYESIGTKRQLVVLNVPFVSKKWHHLCVTHNIGRAFSGGSLLKCYLDGNLVTSEKCRYAKVSDRLTNCTIGAKVNLPLHAESMPYSINDLSAFIGQIGPIYLLNESISSEQVKGIFCLGPDYIYSFLDNEAVFASDSSFTASNFNAKDGLASKMYFGLNAQASVGKMLLNVSPSSSGAGANSLFKASVMPGTQLCSRRLLQHIIYCVGGVFVFFPLLFQFGGDEDDESAQFGHPPLLPVPQKCLAAVVVELIASVIDENISNQQQMQILSGFSILGFILQSIPPCQLNLEVISALKHLFNIIISCGLSEHLVKDAISSIFLNPHIWVHSIYEVQRELYMFLIEQFDSEPRFLEGFCGLPRIIDMLQMFYSECAQSLSANVGVPLVYSVTKQIIGQGPCKGDIRKLRLLLLSLGEMSLRQTITVSDLRAVSAFFETSEDVACIEDVLHMIIRVVSEKQLLATFLVQMDVVGGCHIFVDLLKRAHEPVRLLSLQFLGKLLLGLPCDKKGSNFFVISVGRSRPFLQSHRKVGSNMQPIFSAISDRIFQFPWSEDLLATLFDVLLGGASPKQVLQNSDKSYNQSAKRNNSHFLLPEILVVIFQFLLSCEDGSVRIQILSDIIDLLHSNPLNIEALMEHGWNAWLITSTELEVIRNYPKCESMFHTGNIVNEQHAVRNLYKTVLCHYARFVKGGSQCLEETVNFLFLKSEKDGTQYKYLLRDLYSDIVHGLLNLSVTENIFITQPCRDNALFLLRLVDEMLLSEIDYELPYPSSSSDPSLSPLELDKHNEHYASLLEAIQNDFDDSLCRTTVVSTDQGDKWWNFYDNVWTIIGDVVGKGRTRILPKSSFMEGSSLSQIAWDLVGSLNIPGGEMAAAVVSGGIANALVGKSRKAIDSSVLLRGEKCPRIIFRLAILYLCKASLERALRCVHQIVSLLPYIVALDAERSNVKFQLFIWALLSVRLKYGMLDDGARVHVISRLLRETVSVGKNVLSSSIGLRDDDTSSIQNDAGSIHKLIQKNLVFDAAVDEVNYIILSKTDRTKQLHVLSTRIELIASKESMERTAFEDDVRSTIQSIISSDNVRRSTFQLARDEEQQIVAEKWLHIYRTLVDERGPWSANPFPDAVVQHWKLDKTEDNWRRRPKLRQNYRFNVNLCHPPSSTSHTPHVVGVDAGVLDSTSPIPYPLKQILLKKARMLIDGGESEFVENNTEASGAAFDTVVEDFSDGNCVTQKKGAANPIHESSRDSSVTTSYSENGEAFLSVPCVLVSPKRKLVGLLAVTKASIHFSGKFLVEGSGGSSVFEHFRSSNTVESSKVGDLGAHKHNLIRWPQNLTPDIGKSYIVDNKEATHNILYDNQLKSIKRHRRWSILKIKAVHSMRYLLRHTAIEIFFNNSIAPVFLNFGSQKIAKDVGTLIVSLRNEAPLMKGSNNGKNAGIIFVDRRAALDIAEGARESWRRRDMTNFEYLMMLNTLAGRSYNDLTQYPVFPWVLSDYCSRSLDFNKSSTFRDLSKPIGALDLKRFEVFEDRYRNFSDPVIPSFYYGSHYSSMGIVLFYLLRLEPFTALHRSLQGGKFDHADRLFQSIEHTYKNCLSNTSDVKELIPEFFYLPEFLTNSNGYHFGVKQDGEPMDDVCLPPWAKGSPEEFINKNREALESEYVSSNLHNWIDLIFGYKQRGKPAIEAANIFYYLTYEGAVDLDSMDDQLRRSAIEDQIANFGQTPIQLFRKKHPRRGPPIPIAHPLHFAPGSISLTSILSSPISLQPLYIGMIESCLVIVDEDLTMSVKVWMSTQLQFTGNFTFSGSLDPFFGIGADVLSPRRIGSPSTEKIELGSQCFAALQIPSGIFLAMCGNWENSFQVISLYDGRTVQNIRQHKDIVSCVAVTSDGSILATGSFDTTVMVWEISGFKGQEKKVRNIQVEMGRKDTVIAETPFHILCGHDDVITCLYASVELDIVISGSNDGTCIFHTLREGRYIRSIRHPSGGRLRKLVASRHGRIVLYSDDDLSLHLYSINGKHIASSEPNGRLNCVELSSCGQFLVCAGDHGQVVVHSMDLLEVVGRYSGIGKAIKCLAVTPEECFIAGAKDGSLLVYSIENPPLRKANAQVSLKNSSSSSG